MKEPYGKGLASRPGPESYADDGNIVGVALTRGTRSPAIELRNHHFRVPALSCHWGRQHGQSRYWRAAVQRGGVVEPEHV